MRIANNWKSFEVLDTSNGEKLERWGDIILTRPDPQIIWKTPKSPIWESSNACYHRSAAGGGEWEVRNLPKENWVIDYEEMRFKISPTNFKHTGLFPEQAVNWDYLRQKIKAQAPRELNVLNLFAYTGGATLAAASAGAKVCHVDASKGMVSWARENAGLSGMKDKPIRWIVEDCTKFVEREIRRGVRYDGILMDPPSYGRGPEGEVWRLEEQIYNLANLCTEVLSDDPIFFILNSYTTGLSPSVMEYILRVTVGKKFKGEVSAAEIGVPVTASGAALPCGSTAIWEKIEAPSKQ